MPTTPLNRCVLVVAAALAFATLACSDNTNPNLNATCDTEITGQSSPATGTLTLTGNFFHNETVLLRQTVNGQTTTVASGTPAVDRPSLTLIGLPSGSLTLDVVVSCSAGQDDLGTAVYTVK